jgi:hypothetical protein
MAMLRSVEEWSNEDEREARERERRIEEAQRAAERARAERAARLKRFLRWLPLNLARLACVLFIAWTDVKWYVWANGPHTDYYGRPLAYTDAPGVWWGLHATAALIFVIFAGFYINDHKNDR